MRASHIEFSLLYTLSYITPFEKNNINLTYSTRAHKMLPFTFTSPLLFFSFLFFSHSFSFSVSFSFCFCCFLFPLMIATKKRLHLVLIPSPKYIYRFLPKLIRSLRFTIRTIGEKRVRLRISFRFLHDMDSLQISNVLAI